MLQQLALHAEGYSAAKRALGQTLGVSDDLLHLHVGLAIGTIWRRCCLEPELWPRQQGLLLLSIGNLFRWVSSIY